MEGRGLRNCCWYDYKITSFTSRLLFWLAKMKNTQNASSRDMISQCINLVNHRYWRKFILNILNWYLKFWLFHGLFVFLIYFSEKIVSLYLHWGWSRMLLRKLCKNMNYHKVKLLVLIFVIKCCAQSGLSINLFFNDSISFRM